MRVSDQSDLGGYRIMGPAGVVAVASCSPLRISDGYSATSDGLGQQSPAWGHPSYVMLRKPTCADLFGLGEYSVETASGSKVASFQCKPSSVAPGFVIKNVLRKRRPYGPVAPFSMYEFRTRYNWGLRSSRR